MRSKLTPMFVCRQITQLPTPAAFPRKRPNVILCVMSVIAPPNGHQNGPYSNGPPRPGLTYKTEITVSNGLPPKPTTLPRIKLNGTPRKPPADHPPENGDPPEFKSNGGHTLPRSFGNKEIIKTPNGTIVRRRRVTSHSPRLRKSLNRLPGENIDSDDEVRVAPIGWRNVDIPSERQRSPERDPPKDSPPDRPPRPPRPPRVRSRSLVENVPRRTPADGSENQDAVGSDGEYPGRGFIRVSTLRLSNFCLRIEFRKSTRDFNVRLRAGKL